MKQKKKSKKKLLLILAAVLIVIGVAVKVFSPKKKQAYELPPIEVKKELSSKKFRAT